MNYAMFGVIAGIALLTTTIVNVLPVQQALAVCVGNLFTDLKAACANDPATGGGAIGHFFNPGLTSGSAAGANGNNQLQFGHTGHACAEQIRNGHLLQICV